MARREIVTLVDDLDKVTEEDVATVRFGFLLSEYEIDLSPEHAEQLRAALAPFIAAARRVPHTQVVGAGSHPVMSRPRWAPTPGQRTQAKKARDRRIREYLRASGYPVSDRGTIKKEWVALYERAHPQDVLS